MVHLRFARFLNDVTTRLDKSDRALRDPILRPQSFVLPAATRPLLEGNIIETDHGRFIICNYVPPILKELRADRSQTCPPLELFGARIRRLASKHFCQLIPFNQSLILFEFSTDLNEAALDLGIGLLQF